jgi:eukaryotic-like serine/threonine-protein kinase
MDDDGSVPSDFLASRGLTSAIRKLDTDLIGTSIGVYHITALLGVGGMGEVYRARDSKLGREVAIKILPGHFISDPDRLARFEREARVLASLNHPNIGAIYGLEEADGVRALVLELVEGETLADRVARGPIPLADTLTIARQIAEALDAAHEKGIIHRDLKPTNIKITPDGVVKVLDFGLAKATAGYGATPDLTRSPTVTANGTREGAVLGTAAYMSPEQARGTPVNKRTDIWAFGCVLYEMLTGQPAFDGASVSDTMAAVLTAEPDWNALPAASTFPVRTLLRGCLEKDPRHRIADISAALFVLRHQTTATPIEGPDSHGNAGAIQRRPVTRRLTYFAVGAALIGVVTVLAWRTFDRPLPDPPVVRMALAPPDRTEGFGGSAAVSPDGRLLTFIASTGGRQMLWVRALNALDSQPLAGTEDASYPFWSPDSRHIGFFADGKLKTVDAKGSPPLTLANAYNGRGGTWGTDDTIIYAPGFIDPLHRVDASGRDPKPLTTLDPERGDEGHQWPWFLPDGRHFVFLVKRLGLEDSGIYVGSLDSSERVRLIDACCTNVQYAKPGYLLFLRGQTLMAQAFDVRALTLTGSSSRVAEDIRYSAATQHGFFAASDTGTLVYASGGSSTGNRLVWVDRSGKLVRQVTESRRHGHPTLSPDGQHIAVLVPGNKSGHIWVNRIPDTDVTPFTFGDVNDPQAVWSPTGAELLWARWRPGSQSEFYKKPFNGSESEQMVWRAPAATTSALDNQPTDWSPDGTHLLFQSRAKNTGWDLWVLPLSGDQKPRALIQTPSDEGQGQFSPDGRWVAYASAESGQLEVYVQRFPLSGTKSRVSVAGGILPAWRRDSKELFFLEPGTERMMAVDVSTDTEDFRSNKPHLLFQLPAMGSSHALEPGSHYGVTPDGQRFLVILNDLTPVKSLNVIVNWSSDLPR